MRAFFEEEEGHRTENTRYHFAWLRYTLQQCDPAEACLTCFFFFWRSSGLLLAFRSLPPIVRIPTCLQFYSMQLHYFLLQSKYCYTLRRRAVRLTCKGNKRVLMLVDRSKHLLCWREWRRGTFRGRKQSESQKKKKKKPLEVNVNERGWHDTNEYLLLLLWYGALSHCASLRNLHYCGKKKIIIIPSATSTEKKTLL